MKTKFIIMNKHTMEVYYVCLVGDKQQAKESWAQKCGHENFAEFERKLSVPLDDVEFNAVLNENPQNILDKVRLIMESHPDPKEWIFFIRIGERREIRWEWLGVPEDLGEPPVRIKLLGGEPLRVVPSRLCMWSDVPPEIKKIVEDIVL